MPLDRPNWFNQIPDSFPAARRHPNSQQNDVFKDMDFLLEKGYLH